jgi:hypothetical protein
MEILSCSRNTVYNLLAEGKLTGHNDKPKMTGIRVTVRSVNEYLEIYELPVEYFSDKDIPIISVQRKTISKGVE